MKFPLLVFAAGLLVTSAQAQVLRSATDRAAQIYWYEQSLNERATQESRELGRVLGLNESEVQLIRQFAAARLQAENEAQALIINDPVARREATMRASAQFQTRLVNTLNESQMQRYFQLLAETSAPVNPGVAAPVIAAGVAPAIAPSTPVKAPTAPAVVRPALKKVVGKPSRRHVPIGAYRRRQR